MPLRSKAQSRFFRWAAANPAKAKAEGLAPGATEKMLADSAGQRVRDLPERVQHHATGGEVSSEYPRRFRW